MKSSLILLIVIWLISCNSQKEADFFVETVQGRIKPGEMGLTLIHEHVLVDFIGADATGYHRWDRVL